MDCPFAYYIHCMAHWLQLALVVASREVIHVHQLFSDLTFKSISLAYLASDMMLQAAQATEIAT